ncbi:MAG: BON domain-containing protein [Gammaproteobacteria bacterium]|nr:BON domain-containing protein [Gammaproteobacteria bacterium]
MRLAGFALIGAWALGGCVAAVVGHGSGYGSATPASAASAADVQLASDVRARLGAAQGLPAAAIEVQAREGMVTLRGRVASAAQRATAERIARSVPGVKAVVSELEVR